MRSARSLVAALVMMLTTSIPVRAQDEPFDGWVLLGIGTGSATISCNECTGGRNLHGPTLLASVGWQLTPHVGVGIGLDQWWRDPADSEATNTGTVLLRYYPGVRAGAFLEAGVGLSEADVGLSGDTTAAGRRWALMVGIGYDVKLVSVNGADVTLTPRVSYVYSPIGTLTYAAGRPPFATGWRHQVLSAGIGLGLTGPRTRQ